MKRFVSLLLVCMILCSIVPVYAGETYSIDEPYDFEIYPYNPEFKKLELEERYSIPEELVPQMTTKALVETYLICSAPGQWMMMDITKLGNFVMGRVYPYSNVLRELLDREDLTETLFSMYDASGVPAMTEEQIENMNAWLSGQRPQKSESVFWADIAQARTQSLEELMIVDQIHNGEYTWEEKQQLYPMLEEKKLAKTSLSDQYGYADRVYEWYVMSTGSFRGSDWPFDSGDPAAVGDNTGLVHPIGIPSKVYTHFGREVTTSYNRVPDFSSSQISKALRFIEDDYDVIYVPNQR